MKKNLFALLIVVVLASMVFSACAPAATPAPAPAEETELLQKNPPKLLPRQKLQNQQKFRRLPSSYPT